MINMEKEIKSPQKTLLGVSGAVWLLFFALVVAYVVISILVDKAVRPVVSLGFAAGCLVYIFLSIARFALGKDAGAPSRALLTRIFVSAFWGALLVSHSITDILLP